MDDTNPFATFQPQTGPTFQDMGKTDDSNATKEVLAPSPPTRSRRSRRTAAAVSPVSSGEKPRRKYTRRAVATAARDERNTIIASGEVSTFNELEIVTDIVTRLRALDAKTRARVTAAIGKLL